MSHVVLTLKVKNIKNQRKEFLINQVITMIIMNTIVIVIFVEGMKSIGDSVASCSAYILIVVDMLACC